jgi:hypothetical protein
MRFSAALALALAMGAATLIVSGGAARGQPAPGACGSYTNSCGNSVPRPCGNWTANPGAPAPGATALCEDGSYSYSQHPYSGGTCSHHGGVAQHLD